MASTKSNEEIIQYVPFMSFVHPSFWHALTKMKLEVDKLNEATKQICGCFTCRDDVGTLFEVDGTAFNQAVDGEELYQNVIGTLMNKNTIEDFKNIDKAALLNSVGETMWANVKKKIWITNPTTLLNFFILSFADLKKFHYYYWFAFPSPSQPTLYLKEVRELSADFSTQQYEDLIEGYSILDSMQKCFFLVTKDNDNAIVSPLSEILRPNEVEQKELNMENKYFAFGNPNTEENPGWPLRLFLAALLQHCPCLANTCIDVISVRLSTNGTVDACSIYTIKIPENFQTTESAGWVGWERNDKGNFGPKLANMSSFMDPKKLAEASSDLNLKLMKWRLVPDMDIALMKHTKCLLLGAGTLGCHVARDLLAWGFRHMTFIDSGKVSYSNPTRQVLFNFTDCHGAGRKKAEAAAENLKLILPTVKSNGLIIHIPMPSHPIGESMMEETVANIKTLTDAIAEHDAIFLLLDTREARWLPTLIAAHYGKIVINAALGFDSYLVMRHGLGVSPQEAVGPESPWVAGSQLGCYFCNDVTAPGNSLADRTLDQQCTVTRPGVSAIASALAVEILVALLQHPLRGEAPAVYNINGDIDDLPQYIQGVLGPIPHSIRGFLHSYQTVAPTCSKFLQCVACSDIVINKYREDGIEFLLKVFNSGKYLEEVTGLSELHLSAEMTEILTLSDED